MSGLTVLVERSSSAVLSSGSITSEVSSTVRSRVRGTSSSTSSSSSSSSSSRSGYSFIVTYQLLSFLSPRILSITHINVFPRSNLIFWPSDSAISQVVSSRESRKKKKANEKKSPPSSHSVLPLALAIKRLSKLTSVFFDVTVGAFSVNFSVSLENLSRRCSSSLSRDNTLDSWSSSGSSSYFRSGDNWGFIIVTDYIKSVGSA